MVKETIKNTKQKGQTLLFVIVATTIALAIGVSVSTRTISSLRRVSRTDTSQRVIAAAEGGIENMLGRTYIQLDAAINPDDITDCEAIGADSIELVDSTNYCVYNFPSVQEDQISTRALVTVEEFNTNEGGGYAFALEPGKVREVHLEGYTNNEIVLCIDAQYQDPVVYYISYDSSGEVTKGGVYPMGSAYGYDDVGGDYTSNFSEASPSGDYYCTNIPLVSNNTYGLRLKALYGSTSVLVRPSVGFTIPVQGYVLTSRGELTGTDEESVEESATVIVHKSYPYAADIFDYGIYTPQPLN